MRKIVIILVAIFLISCGFYSSNKSEQINVLFIGNSLTYYNDMPQKLQEMMNETNSNISIEQITYPGMSLSGHLEKIVIESTENNIKTKSKAPGELTETEKKIAEKDWDFIILQTGGVSVLIPESMEFNVNPSIEKIKEINDNTNTRFILFNTWITKEDFPVKYCYKGLQISRQLERMNDYCSTELKSSNQYLQELNNAYNQIAEQNSLEKTNHGDIFQEIFDNYSELEILEDEMHPSDLGAYLSACIFYKIITNNDPSELKYNGEIDPNKAQILKNVVE